MALPYKDGKVVVALCIGGLVKYDVKQGLAVTDGLCCALTKKQLATMFLMCWLSVC